MRQWEGQKRAERRGVRPGEGQEGRVIEPWGNRECDRAERNVYFVEG